MSKNDKYWEDRAVKLEERRNRKVKRTQKEIKEFNDRLQKKLKRKLLYWIVKFANNNNLTLNEAMNYMTREELEDLQYDVWEYIQLGKSYNLDDEQLEVLINLSAKHHLRRLDAVMYHIESCVNLLALSEIDKIERHLIDLFMDTSYTTMYDLALGIDAKVNLFIPDMERVRIILSEPWTDDGIEFSERIWGKHRQELIDRLKKDLIDSIVKGDNAVDMAEKLADDFEVTQHQAEVLLQTESAYFGEEARTLNFNELGVEQYIIVATLDSKTSKICRSMDGKVFDMANRKVGENAPPFHPRCRTTIAPYFDYLHGKGTRIGRDKDGNTIYVPDDMTYQEFYDKYIKSDPVYLKEEKKWKNRHSDKKQFKKYKKAGVKVPRSFDKFQNMKYNDDKVFWRAKNQYRSFNAIDKKEWTEPFKNKCKETIKRFADKYDLDFNEHSVARYHDRISNKGKTSYMSEKDFVELAKSKPNYIELDGGLVVYENTSAVVFDSKHKTQIKSIVVDRNKPKKEWRKID